DSCRFYIIYNIFYFFFSSRRRHTRLQGDWSSDVCSSDLTYVTNKIKACGEIGIESIHHPLPASASIAELVDLVKKLNASPKVDRSEERRVGKECRSRWSRYE